MQLFSQKKALVAASLSALVALGACGDNVTVPVPPAAVVTISITPPSASMNVGERLNFAVQITGGSTTAAPTLASCTSSNAAVITATVAGNSCAVTAVAAGNATVTATASTGNSAAASINVAAPAPAISGIVLTPAAANIAVNGTVTITAVPSTSGAGVTLARQYTSSSSAIASVSAAGVVTGISAGQATITVTLTGSGTGLTTTTTTGNVLVTVTALPPGLTAVNVTPSAVSLISGQTPVATQALVPRATVATGASAATFTYGTSNPAVATVSATGVVTAVGAGTAVITVTASSAASATFSASTATALVPVTVGAPAQVIINSVTQRGGNLDLSNVIGQFEVNVQLAPNQQVISTVETWVCLPAETVTACIARSGTPAAQQTFGSAGAQLGQLTLYVNTADFANPTPNFVTGADVNTTYKNGLKTVVATINTTNTAAPNASNNITLVNFNNPDGWTIDWTQPTNRANDAQGITWYGGPTMPDALISGATSGLSSFTVLPVIYTPNRTIAQATLAIRGLTCGQNPNGTLNENLEPITLRSRPFRASFGVQVRDTLAGRFNCEKSSSLLGGPINNGGAAAHLSLVAPQVTASVDNNNAQGPTATVDAPGPAQSIYNTFVVDGVGGAAVGANTTRYRQAVSFTPNRLYIPMDYQAPIIYAYDVRGGGSVNSGGGWVDSAWVNGTYQLAGGFAQRDTTITLTNGNTITLRAGDPFRLRADDDSATTNNLLVPFLTKSAVGVGLLGSGPTTGSRNVRFNVCLAPAIVPVVGNPVDTVRYVCTAPVASGGINSTVSSITLPEAANLTNSAYYVQATETDRLGNRGASNPYPYQLRQMDGSLFQYFATSAFNEPIALTAQRTSPQSFGVDLTPPVALAIPSPSATEDVNNPSLRGFARTAIDSIFSTLHNTHQASTTVASDISINANNARFAVRTRDERSGFYNCTNTGVAGSLSNSCANTTAGQFSLGTFQIERRNTPLSPTSDNNAVIVNLNSTSSTVNSVGFNLFATTMNGTGMTNDGTTLAGDPSVREFSISIAGQAARGPVPVLTQPATTAQAGYYTFTGVLIDRAGNRTTLPTRRVAIDNQAPSLNNLIVPSFYTGGALNQGVTLQASDDLEIMGADMTLGFPQLSINFPRVTNFTAAIRTGLFQNPFAALTSGKLVTPTGAGQFFNGQVNLPIPFIQDMQLVADNSIVVPGINAPIKPTSISALVYDIRSMWTPSGAFTAPTTSGTPQFTSVRSNVLTTPISGTQVSQGTFNKNWGADVGSTANGTFNAGAGIDQWFIYSLTTTGGEFRARSISSLTNVPFQAVRVVTRRQNVSTLAYDAAYEAQGTVNLATFAGTVDQGGQRYFRYTWTAPTSVAQGANSSILGMAGGDSVRAIGIDASGNALATAAAIPGTAATANVITTIASGLLHLSDGVAAIPSSQVQPLVQSVIASFPSWQTRNNAASPTVIQFTPLSTLADATTGVSRAFIRNAGANATARVWLTLTQPAGATPSSSLITTITCTSNDPSIVVVASGWGIAVGNPAPAERPFCDVRGVGSGTGTISFTAAQGASAPYTASTATNTTGSQVLFTGPNNLTAIGAAVPAAPVAGPSAGTTVAAIAVAAPAFVAPADANNSSMVYATYFSNATARYVGISIGGAIVNPLTGSATVNVTCTTATATINGVAAGVTPIGVIIQGRAINAFGYSAPFTQAVNFTCN